MKKNVVFHPFLFAILPILFLYSHNLGQLTLSDLPLPLLTASTASLLLFLLLWLILRSGLQAALLSTLFWIWFFSYGHLQVLLTSARRAQPGFSFAGAWYFLAAYGLLLLVSAFFLIRMRRGARTLSSALNFAAVALVMWHTLAIGGYEIKRARGNRNLQQAAPITSTHSGETRKLPNIYYIILDGYARADVLEEIYHLDNDDLIQYLTGKGFHVAHNAKSNYCLTMSSLASSLNFTYLDDLAAQVGEDYTDHLPLRRMIHENRLFEFLRQHGYRIVAFPSVFLYIELRGADLFVTKSRMTSLSEFQECILSATPLLLFFRYQNPSSPFIRGPFANALDYEFTYRRKISFALENLPDTVSLNPPIFVFAHILSPHPPFLFDREGGKVPCNVVALNPLLDGNGFPGTTEEYVSGYREQVLFINSKLKALIDKILAESNTPPIIIIQADHGAGSRFDWTSADKTDMTERFGILLAYYLPEGEEVPAYDDLSPVNIFRLVLNHCFGANLELLPNECYFTTWDRPYRFLRVTDKVEDAKP
jgi:hypothetical protein